MISHLQQQRWERKDLVYVPQALAVLSLLYLVCKCVVRDAWLKAGRSQEEQRQETDSTLAAGENEFALDGAGICRFRVLRLASVFLLMSLEFAVWFFNADGISRTRAVVLQPPFYVRTAASLVLISSRCIAGRIHRRMHPISAY